VGCGTTQYVTLRSCVDVHMHVHRASNGWPEQWACFTIQLHERRSNALLSGPVRPSVVFCVQSCPGNGASLALSQRQ
jgi:hypothetical protein